MTRRTGGDRTDEESSVAVSRSRPAVGEDTSPFASLYRQARADLLTVPVTDREVATPDGTTHLLTAGDPDAPPLLLLQGANVTNPVTLSWLQSLVDEYYLLAPDTPGEPAERATESPADYGEWVGSVLDGLGLDSAPVVGVSHGGGVLLEAIAHDPDRISTAALVVSAGFGVSPSATLARVVGLSLAYRLVPRDRLLAAALSPLFTSPVPHVHPVVRETVALALRTADVKTGFPGPAGPEALAAFDEPTLLIGAAGDPFFPAAWLHERSRGFLPADTERVTLVGERHFLSPVGQERVTREVRSFLADAVGR
ncbi:alpha/beta hydrolase [Salinirubellus salinus]|uniref:Alpha/beta hydrolase n=1 Tax=Salinirubellus salinus TaxID=1364945 RepID=A0A9E7R1I8_9EURY|nr:alpha/beta hydrolase [Salinirubellus salinus]UWM53891.1 alpha/beta hydrolase [Salinirubellus salinus]